MSTRSACFAFLALSFASFGCAAGTETKTVDKTSTASGTTLPGDETTPSDPTTSASPGSKGTSTPTTSSGPIQLKNLSVSSAGSSAEITFVVKNTGAESVDRVQQVRISYGGTSAFMTSCTSSAYDSWSVAAYQQSSVITLRLYDYGSGQPTLETPCGSSYGDATTKPWNGDLTVELRGLLDDATPWKATAVVQP